MSTRFLRVVAVTHLRRLAGLDERIVSTNKRFDEALDIRERLATLEATV